MKPIITFLSLSLSLAAAQQPSPWRNPWSTNQPPLPVTGDFDERVNFWSWTFDTNQFVITNANVGIGTNAPASALVVKRDQPYNAGVGVNSMTQIRVDNPNPAGFSAFSIWSGTEKGRMQYNAALPNIFFSTVGSIPFYIGTDNQIRMAVNGTNGDVELRYDLRMPTWSIGTTNAIYFGTLPVVRLYTPPLDVGGQAYGENVFFGGAGNSTLANGAGGIHLASRNFGSGLGVLTNLTTGFNNTFSGWQSGSMLDVGNNNAGFGYGVMQFATNAQYNSGFGSWSMWQLRNGNDNTALGGDTLFSLITGSENSSGGSYSSISNIVGSRNTVWGTRALFRMTNGSHNLAFGAYSAYSAENADGIGAIGFRAGYYETQPYGFYLNNYGDQGSLNGDKTNSLAYGRFAAAAANQELAINAKFSIQTTQHLNQVDIVGPSSVNIGGIGTGGILRLAAGGYGHSDDHGLFMGVNSSDNYAWVQAAKPNNFYMPMRINGNGGSVLIGSGTVGIGTNSPEARLHVIGTGANADLQRWGTTASDPIASINTNGVIFGRAIGVQSPINAFGSLMLHINNSILNLSVQNTFYQITNYNTAVTNWFYGLSAEGSLTNLIPGYYGITLAGSIDSVGNANHLHMHLFTNNVECDVIGFESDNVTGALQTASGAGTGIIYAPAGTRFDLRVANKAATGFVTNIHTMLRIGAP